MVLSRLPLRTAEALTQLPPRLDAPAALPWARGGYLNLHEWRRDEWTPAVRAAGLAHRSPNALRHTFASFSIAAGALFELSRFMGTSVTQIEKTYGHSACWLSGRPDSNRGPPVPQTGALTRLRHAPWHPESS